LAARGWASYLAVLVTAAISIEAVTGLWVYLAPFSLALQLQLLVHVAVGLVLLGPFVVFQVRHLLVWCRQKPTVVMALGYLLAGMVVTALLSGGVLTWQCAAGPQGSSVWRNVHLVSGAGVAVLLPLHLAAAFARRRAASAHTPALSLALQRFWRWNFAALAIGTTAVFAAAAAWHEDAVDLPLPEGYTIPAYFDQFDEYRGSPFAPTYARTASGQLVNPAVLSGSASCGTSGCHEEILGEWQPSAHRFSAMNPPFQAVQRNFAAERGAAETRYCAGCHDPISLFAGTKDIHDMDLSAPGIDEGCSCVVCHSISKVDQRGNADYVLVPPRKYLWEGAAGWRKFLSDFLIRAHPDQHLADYDRALLRTPEFCGACHKQFIPEALNRFGLSPGQNQFDEWRKSHWHVDDPAKDLSCRDCHMRLVRGSHDPGRGEDGDVRRSPSDGAHRHHGMIATNLLMPAVLKLPHWEEQYRLSEQWIRGETVIEEIAHLWPPGPVASVQILGPDAVRPGEELTLRVVTLNRKAGHNLTTGPLDFMQAWVHLRVTGAGGDVLAEWGRIDPVTRRLCDEPQKEHKVGNSRKEGTLVLEGIPLDAKGNELLKHELWRKAGGKGQRVIFPNYSDNQAYAFTVPSDARGRLTVRADLNYRRYRQDFLDLVVPEMERESGVIQPTVTQASETRTIEVAAAPAGPGQRAEQGGE
jgi:hypothetical protein